MPDYRSVTLGRLTRQELGWLLTQEARGAARRLRVEVGELRATTDDASEDRASSLPGELTLNELDNAIDVLSQLQTEPRSRRKGLLDLAAILYELAPDWQVMLEPGAGTQVSGDEEEYRRMLQVLLTQSGVGHLADNTPAVEIRREGDWVRVSTALGPDVASSSELERRWLSRMAVRLGGRYELLGKSQSLVLPADNDDRVELKALRDELLQAQQLGQSYALELAQALSSADRTQEAETRAAQLAVRWALGIAARASAAGDILAAVARVDATSAPTRVALSGALEAALGRAEPAARARGVAVNASPTEVQCEARASVLQAQLELLLRHAIDATAPGEAVSVRTQIAEGEIRIEFEHGADSRKGGLQARTSPPRSAAGPDPTLALLAAGTLELPQPGSTTAARGVVRTEARGARWASILCYPAPTG